MSAELQTGERSPSTGDGHAIPEQKSSLPADDVMPLVTRVGDETYLSSPLLSLIDEYIEEHSERTRKVWLGVSSLIGTLFVISFSLVQLYLNSQKEAGLLATAAAARIEVENATKAAEKKYDLLEERFRNITTDINSKLREAESASLRFTLLKEQAADAQRQYRGAESETLTARDRLRSATDRAERDYVALSTVLQSMIRVINANPVLARTLDLRGVKVGEMVLIAAGEAENIEGSDVKSESSPWCPADGREVRGSAYARSPGRNNVPDLRPLTAEFDKLYGTQFGPSITFYVRIN